MKLKKRNDAAKTDEERNDAAKTVEEKKDAFYGKTRR